MRLKAFIFVFLLLFNFIHIRHALCVEPDGSLTGSGTPGLSLEEVVTRVEKKYEVPGFSADFLQKSTIKAMDIADTATGRIIVKRPDMMRWEYKDPERQLIITDGEKLWIYRPEDNQVMTGEFPSFFGGGKGASFLSDIKLIKQKFSIFFENKENDSYLLKLLPKEKKLDLSIIYLYVSKDNFLVDTIVTYNSYGDETRIDFSNIKLLHSIDDDIFTFDIPYGTEVLELNE